MKKLVMTAIFFCGLALTGCKNESADKELSASGAERSTAIPEETTISEALNKKGRQIWYKVDEETSKDSKASVYVFKNNTLRVYSLGARGNLTIGDLSKMTDDEIIKTVQEMEILQLQDDINSKLSSYELSLSSIKQSKSKGYNPTGDTTKIEAVISALKEISASDFEIPAVKYSLNIESDSTGNNTETEEFIFTKNKVSLPIYTNGDDVGNNFNVTARVVQEKDETKLVFESGYSKFQIYDTWYSGLKMKSGDYFVTRDQNKDGSISFVLDQPGTKGVTVDE
ncbi:hypothetical protein [Enterococcus sp. CWB-B31]|uniref:hypothetical protein n=1 Tax=Enterococcus sp. CWB-B31 TaxID=2885159 RepID=UPI001E37088D|nr:hypothetical protein [Enterococcus sp. CWB-B31]MCB5953957.1 hypothetical protein [Enterococcus sp. CWB-B31]